MFRLNQFWEFLSSAAAQNARRLEAVQRRAPSLKHLMLVAALSGGFLCSGCKKSDAGTGAAKGAFAVQAVLVEAKAQSVSESLSLVGSVAANEAVEIKSEADGTIE